MESLQPGVGRTFYLAVVAADDMAETALTVPAQMAREVETDLLSDRIYFVRNGMTPDLWSATLDLSGPPVLTDVALVEQTDDLIESRPSLSADGACLAYPAGDLTVPYGPNADLHVRDLQTGEVRRITLTRDIGAVAWVP